MLNLKDITAMTFHLNENNNPEEEEESRVWSWKSMNLFGLEIMTVNHAFSYVTLDFLDPVYFSSDFRAKDVMNASINWHYFRPSYKKFAICVCSPLLTQPAAGHLLRLKLTLVKLRLCNFMHQSSMSKKGGLQRRWRQR